MNHSYVYLSRVPAQSLSRVQLFETPWTLARQAPLSMRFSRQEYFSGLPFPPPGDLPNPGIKPTSPACPALAGSFFSPETPGKPQVFVSPLPFGLPIQVTTVHQAEFPVLCSVFSSAIYFIHSISYISFNPQLIPLSPPFKDLCNFSSMYVFTNKIYVAHIILPFLWLLKNLIKPQFPHLQKKEITVFIL